MTLLFANGAAETFFMALSAILFTAGMITFGIGKARMRAAAFYEDNYDKLMEDYVAVQTVLERGFDGKARVKDPSKDYSTRLDVVVGNGYEEVSLKKVRFDPNDPDDYTFKRNYLEELADKYNELP